MRTMIAQSRSLGAADVEAAVRASGFDVTQRLIGDLPECRDSAEAIIGVWDGESDEVARSAAWARRSGLRVYVHMVAR